MMTQRMHRTFASTVTPRLQKSLRIDRGHTSGSCRRDGLTIGRVLNIARGKHAWHARRGASLRHEVAFGIHVQLSGKQTGIRSMTNRDEHTCAWKSSRGACDEVFEPDTGDATIA